MRALRKSSLPIGCKSYEVPKDAGGMKGATEEPTGCVAVEERNEAAGRDEM